MSLVKLNNGQKFEVETPSGARTGVMRQRERSVLSLTFKAGDERFEEIKKAFLNTGNTEGLTLYFPDEKETATDAQLEGVAKEEYIGYTLVGEVKEEDVLVKQGDYASQPQYGRKLTIELGQRQFGETL